MNDSANEMTDPAVEAARKADTREDGEPVYWSTTRDAMVAAADEALQPIRELSETWTAALTHDSLIAEESKTALAILDELAPFIYATGGPKR
jgi:hypothetical protein